MRGQNRRAVADQRRQSPAAIRPPGKANPRASVFMPGDDRVILLDRETASREISTALTNFHSKSFISTTSADSCATSAPYRMAMPMSAKLERRQVVDAIADHRDDGAAGVAGVG